MYCTMPYIQKTADLLLSDCGQDWRWGGDGGIVHCSPGDDQLDAVAALPQHLGHLFAAHAVEIRVPDLQDVVPAVQTTILTNTRVS